MDTEYTKGFKAGMAWREMEIIRLLEAWLNDDNADFGETLALIKRDSDDLP